jgi:hypothetical protein
MKRAVLGVCLVAGCLMSFVLLANVKARAGNDEQGDRDSRVTTGFRIAPVALRFKRKDREAVGIGSYLVNAVGACNDCHTCPSFEPGHNPYGPPFGPPNGGDGKVNAKNYLAGGTLFDPPGVTSANLTPSTTSGLPEGGNTFAQFKHLIRTGHDPDENNRILQVMPWPVYKNMTDEDLWSIYLYLKAIPHAEPGLCVAPGQ